MDLYHKRKKVHQDTTSEARLRNARIQKEKVLAEKIEAFDIVKRNIAEL